MRIGAAYDRWIAECLATVAREPLGSTCAAVLHLTCLKNRPKTPAEIARLLNRDDVPNVIYSILASSRMRGLVERQQSQRSKSASYRVTRRGRRVALDYAALRAEVLMRARAAPRGEQPAPRRRERPDGPDPRHL